MSTALASLFQPLVAAGSAIRRGGVCGPADGDQYAGLVTDDVHHLGGEQVLAAALDEDDGARFAEDEGGARVVAGLS